MKDMNGHEPRQQGSGAPGAPGTPGDPGAPEVLGDPGDPGVPDVPSDPSVPDIPGDPGVPDIPGDPEVPSIPGDPKVPGGPGVPEVPGGPSGPEVLGDPNDPDSLSDLTDPRDPDNLSDLTDPRDLDSLSDYSDPPSPSLRASLEAILLVADEPVPAVVLAQVLERPTEQILALLRDTAVGYAAEGRGFDLREIAGGWRFYTREECAPVVERFVSEGQEVRLTQAALETLAVVAYRQPVSRARVSAVRGVNCDGVMRTLTLRGLVEDAGTDPETGAILYRTTGYFLERLGLASLAELPDLAPFLPDSVEDADETMEAGHERARP